MGWRVKLKKSHRKQKKDKDEKEEGKFRKYEQSRRFNIKKKQQFRGKGLRKQEKIIHQVIQGNSPGLMAD